MRIPGVVDGENFDYVIGLVSSAVTRTLGVAVLDARTRARLIAADGGHAPGSLICDEVERAVALADIALHELGRSWAEGRN